LERLQLAAEFLSNQTGEPPGRDKDLARKREKRIAVLIKGLKHV